jgi:hypothetical protein
LNISALSTLLLLLTFFCLAFAIAKGLKVLSAPYMITSMLTAATIFQVVSLLECPKIA